MSNKLLAGLLALTLAGAGCGDDGGSNNGAGNNGGDNNGQNTEPFSEDCTTMIVPSTAEDEAEAAEENRVNITEALVAPSDGDVICLGDGTYNLTAGLTLNASDVANIEIRGQSQDGTILDFAGQDQGANGLLVDGIDDFRAADFTLKNTAGDAIKVQNSDGVELVNLTVTWDRGPSSSNGAYGVYPVLDTNVLVEGCNVSHASDAGIYVGQTDTAIVRNNVAFGNVAGLEIENTSNSEVHDNHLYDNTGGLLVFNLPGLEVKGGAQNKIHNNLIENNNQVNFAASGIVEMVPAGIGLLLIAADNNEIYENEVTGNQSMGLGIVSYLATGLQHDDAEYDPYSEGNFVHDNTFENNGYDPKGLALTIATANSQTELQAMLIDGVITAELDADTTFEDVRDCFDGNQTGDGGDAEFFNFDFLDSDAPEGITDCSDTWTDFCHYQCTRDPLPSVTLE
jgi:parallel beta-helix repeat protein